MVKLQLASTKASPSKLPQSTPRDPEETKKGRPRMARARNKLCFCVFFESTSLKSTEDACFSSHLGQLGRRKA